MQYVKIKYIKANFICKWRKFMSVIKKQHIYLPKKHLDYSKWAVIACDQFTSEPNYWEQVSKFVEGAPTTLDLTFPEIYLGKDNHERIDRINKNMRSYYDKGLVEDAGPCMILVDRSTSLHPHRLGLVMNVDLETYDFRSDVPALIKATEGTIIERIPPRVEIRKDAILEFPHIMLLFDDRKQKIVETLYANRQNLEKVYDFDLNMGGGHISGWKVKNVDEVISQFDKLLDKDYLKETFNTETPLLFAVGDGNHSLATAKEHWNRIKVNLSEAERENHPARYVLVEAVNIHDQGIEFSPIYRVIKGADSNFVKGLKRLYKGPKDEENCKKETIFVGNKAESYDLPNNSPLAIKLVQDYIDNCLTEQLEMSVDYVHGLDSLQEICAKDNCIGLTLPTLDKSQLFEFVIKHGVLPRKSFSIGEAREKRYYLESHKIKLI